MTADVIQLRDYDWLPPRAGVRVEGSAEVVILPVVRVERLIEASMIKPPRGLRRSLLGES